MDDAFDPAVVALFRDGADDLLDSASRMRTVDRDPELLAELAGRMALTGIAMGVAGRTAPLSGTEHLVSHLLDMDAAASGRETALHGAQVGVASVLAATIWHDTLDRFDPGALLADGAASEPTTIEHQVRDAFDPIDPSGRMSDECWRDVRRKVERWGSRRSAVEAFVADWDRHRAALRDLVATPERLRTALVEAGAAATVAELDPPAAASKVRWALAALPLMRDRFTVADLRYLAGAWNAGAIDRLLDRSGILEGAA
jgi:glycerol-1-phosphate dehydrogenase [NAD(P)+]